MDIGAGIGVLEHYLIQKLGTPNLNMSPLEPVPQIAEFLRQDYPQFNVINKDLETFADTSGDKFDVIFCLGVDYLSRNLRTSYAQIAKLGKRRWVFSCNVFLEMESYYMTKRIEKFEDLVGPNPLIGAFMSRDQYLEMLQRNFSLNFATIMENPQTIPDRPSMQILIADCGPLQPRPATPVRNTERAIARLVQLGVPVS